MMKIVGAIALGSLSEKYGQIAFGGFLNVVWLLLIAPWVLMSNNSSDREVVGLGLDITLADTV